MLRGRERTGGGVGGSLERGSGVGGEGVWEGGEGASRGSAHFWAR